jgi:hypothetical protein
MAATLQRLQSESVTIRRIGAPIGGLWSGAVFRRRAMRVANGGTNCLILAVCMTAAAQASAAPAPRHHPRPPAKLSSAATPARAALTSITVDPSHVTLTGPLARQHLLVTGHCSDGSETDLTSQAILKPARQGVVRLEQGALLAPAAAGSVDVTVRVGARSARVPVVVKDIDKVAPVSLANDVEPIFTKIGCNQGTCHGQQNGKGGFKLSLRGYDPGFDLEQIAKDSGGKRIDAKDPEKSLLLLKPTMQVPHGGGPRLVKGSPEYNLILRWIREGRAAPTDKEPHIAELRVTPAERIVSRPGAAQHIIATAKYSDGTERDVTALCRFASQNDAVASVTDEGLITTRQPGESAIMVSYGGEVKVSRVLVPRQVPPLDLSRLPRANFIDGLVYRKLAQMRIPPSGRATDAEFLRRVSLDAIATLPTPAETRAFLRDTDPLKRAKLIDRLLDRPEYVDFRTLKLCDMLRVNGQYVSEEGADTYYRWIHDRVQENEGYDKFVRELLTGKGSSFRCGPANYFRVATTPQELAETTAQTFLGVRIQCAQCHNHPFERWKQKDYYGLAGFFAQVGRKGGPEFGEEQVYVTQHGDATNPRTKQVIAPKFLGGEEPKLDPEGDRRAALADWLTAKSNFDFARVAVNRIWAEYFGKGIVDAVDDFRTSNPASNEPLLDALARTFIAQNYDVKKITRLILNSETYQRSSVILPGNVKDERYFARSYPRRLPAETLTDAIAQITGKPDRFGAYPLGWRAIQVRDSKIGSYFLEVFGRPKREIVCACERSPQPNLAQSLHLINSDTINSKLAARDGKLAQILRRYQTIPLFQPAADSLMIQEMYLSALCRYPTEAETHKFLLYFAKAPDHHRAAEDALWALLNSEEFEFNK